MNGLRPESRLRFDIEFRNDHTIVPRSTTIIAQRLPAKKPHKGTAQHYVVETVSSNTPITANQTQQPQKAEYRGRMSMRFDRPAEQPNVRYANPTLPFERKTLTLWCACRCPVYQIHLAIVPLM